MAKKDNDASAAKLNKNASSMQRRMNTPFILTYRWYYFAICFVMFGIFFIINWILWFFLSKSDTFQGNFFGIIYAGTSASIYNPDLVRLNYNLNTQTLNYFIKPALVILIVGVIMLFVRKKFYRSYVDKEVNKMIDQMQKRKGL